MQKSCSLYEIKSNKYYPWIRTKKYSDAEIPIVCSLKNQKVCY